MTAAIQKKDAPAEAAPGVREALSMIREIDVEDIEIGRNPVGMDPNEFDWVPPREADFDEEDAGYVLAGDPAPFRRPAKEQFPLLKAAIRHFQGSSPKPRAVRIDNNETYLGFASEQALKEIDRRLRELRTVVEEHMSDEHGAPSEKLPKWDVIGAAKAIVDLRRADTAREAMDKLEQVPIDLPGYARGKVHCWRDGDCVICSMHFAAADGTPRVATGAGRASVDADEVAQAAINAGVEPTTVLGMVDDLAAVALAKRLVKEVAAMALKAHKRQDVLGMSNEPVVLTRGGSAQGAAPLAAIMYLQQRAESGDEEAQLEMEKLKSVAATQSGRAIAAPVLAESHRRLHEGRQKKALGGGWLMKRYASAAGWI